MILLHIKVVINAPDTRWKIKRSCQTKCGITADFTGTSFLSQIKLVCFYEIYRRRPWGLYYCILSAVYFPPHRAKQEELWWTLSVIIYWSLTFFCLFVFWGFFCCLFACLLAFGGFCLFVCFSRGIIFNLEIQFWWKIKMCDGSPEH